MTIQQLDLPVNDHTYVQNVYFDLEFYLEFKVPHCFTAFFLIPNFYGGSLYPHHTRSTELYLLF